jgi:hypothetical protein
MGFEPTTFCLEGRRSTPELHPHSVGASGFATAGSPAPAGNHRPLDPPHTCRGEWICDRRESRPCGKPPTS